MKAISASWKYSLNLKSSTENRSHYDLVTYEGETAKEVKAAFEEAVESYLETCAQR
jgi:predicted HicB family RNase H-like nuclease